MNYVKMVFRNELLWYWKGINFVLLLETGRTENDSLQI